MVTSERWYQNEMVLVLGVWALIILVVKGPSYTHSEGPSIDAQEARVHYRIY